MSKGKKKNLQIEIKREITWDWKKEWIKSKKKLIENEGEKRKCVWWSDTADWLRARERWSEAADWSREVKQSWLVESAREREEWSKAADWLTVRGEAKLLIGRERCDADWLRAREGGVKQSCWVVSCVSPVKQSCWLVERERGVKQSCWLVDCCSFC